VEQSKATFGNERQFLRQEKAIKYREKQPDFLGAAKPLITSGKPRVRETGNLPTKGS
jgi:hypothetical protein